LYRQRKLAIASCALALGLGATTAAHAAAPQLKAAPHPAQPELELVAKPAQRFERSIEAHKRQVRHRRQVARREARREAAKQRESFALAGGVSQSTLDAIAACESGGDPTVVDASGTYYGKYQFDLGTWASVGGSGNPAAASEAEQDYRASLLYSQAGSSPWPVCGA
jgi:peptidoglycan endopeptidase LytE